MGAIDAFMSTWSDARQTMGEGTPQEGAPFDSSNQLRQMQTSVQSAAPGERWTGPAADSYADANSKQGHVLGQMAGLDQRLGTEVDRSAAVVAAGRQNLDGVKQWVLDAAASVPAGENREQQLLPIVRKGIGDVADVVKQTNGDLNTIGGRIQAIGNEYKEFGGGQKDGEPNDPGSADKVRGDKDDDKRRQNQIDAFKKVFGREPTSPADWSTAAVLDPNSYNAKNQGHNAEVRVVKIRPVPGQGVVRVSQWIEQPSVANFPSPDMGDNRTANPHFDPENARVTTYIDYENGIVVMRQNPSVQFNDNGGPGEVRVGQPQGSVTQTADGAVRIKYDAGNPFAPGPSNHPPEPLHPWTVNGDLVFTPSQGGVHVDGTRTDYPSMEVYQDLPNGTTRTVLIDPAQSGSQYGPLENLPFHHDVGIGGRAFEPFDKGAYNPKYDVRVPLPATEFGPVSNPPSVPPLPPGPGTPV